MVERINDRATKFFFPLVLLSILALLAGLWAGLQRLGWALPGLRSPLPMEHGPLMVSGFLGTLITLERVAALKRGWMFAAPALTGLGWIAALALPGLALGPAMIALGSLGMVLIFGVIVRRERRIHTVLMAVGALAWFGGNLLWLAGLPVHQLVLWWVAFLVLTIAGERLELSRVLRPTPRQITLFAVAAELFLLGAALSPALMPIGTRLAGVGMLAMAAWLVRYDIARRNLRHPAPLTRYIATCLFVGYLWLGLSGLLYLRFGGVGSGAKYDAMLHTVFLGFVFSMIFGHAPIIFPALLNIPIRFRPVSYAYLVLLHASLILRVGSDLSGWFAGRQWGGLLNEIAVLMFLAVTALSVAQALSARKAAA